MDVLDVDEHARLDEWGNRAVLTQRGYRTPMSIPAVFAEQVARDPEAVALTFEGRSMTYGELDEAANRLAHLLAMHGAGPGESRGAAGSPIRRGDRGDPGGAQDRCGVSADRSGGAGGSGWSSCSATPRRSPRSPQRVCARGWTGPMCAVVDVDDRCRVRPASNALPTPAPDDIAYMIYTSGTTGMPKGVAVTHHNVTQVLESLHAEMPAGAGQVWSQWHSLVFDVSVWEIWGALLHGARLVVVPEAVAGSPSDLHDLLVAEKVTRPVPDPVGGRDAVAGGLGEDGVGGGR